MLLTMLFFVLASDSVHAGERLGWCWMEGDAIKCQRAKESPDRCTQPLDAAPVEPVTLKITFAKYNRTIDSKIECCDCNYSVAPFRCDSAECRVRSISTLPAQAYPVTLQLTATVGGQTVASEVRTLNSAADGPQSSAPLAIFGP